MTNYLYTKSSTAVQAAVILALQLHDFRLGGMEFRLSAQTPKTEVFKGRCSIVGHNSATTAELECILWNTNLGWKPRSVTVKPRGINCEDITVDFTKGLFSSHSCELENDLRTAINVAEIVFDSFFHSDVLKKELYYQRKKMSLDGSIDWRMLRQSIRTCKTSNNTAIVEITLKKASLFETGFIRIYFRDTDKEPGFDPYALWIKMNGLSLKYVMKEQCWQPVLSLIQAGIPDW